MNNLNIVPIDPSSSEEGNSRTSSKQCSPAKGWCFTLNNYSEKDISSIVPIFLKIGAKYIFAKEVGESGTPHLQGAVEFSRKLRPLSLGLPKMHWEKRRGTIKQAMEYCAKSDTDRGDIYSNCKIPRGLIPLPCENSMYPWQQSLMGMLNKDPDNRTIIWIWEETGNVGKTTFMKYLMRFHEAIPLEGKKNDILHVAAEHDSELYIYDIERCLETYVSYGSIEKIKNGCFMSGKYEGGIIDRNCPHLVIFANFKPDTEKLSLDRWNIYKIVDLELTT